VGSRQNTQVGGRRSDFW